MAFVLLEDTTGSQETVVFPQPYATFRELLQPDQLVLVSAKVSHRDGKVSLLANSFIAFVEGELAGLKEMLGRGGWLGGVQERAEMTERTERTKREDTAILHRGALSIALKGKPTPEMVDQLRQILQSAPGPKPVCLLVESGGRMRQIETDYSVTVSDGMVDEIASLVGRQNVEVV